MNIVCRARGVAIKRCANERDCRVGGVEPVIELVRGDDTPGNLLKNMGKDELWMFKDD